MHKVEEVARYFRKGSKSFKDQIKTDSIVHTVVKGRIFFTQAQFDACVARYEVTPVAESITTGTAKS
jgi:hypothetical protein